jgi:hypothetical protein
MSVLMEQWARPEQGEALGRRIHSDGTVEEHAASTAAFENGDLVYTPQEPRWRTLATAEPPVLGMLESAIRDSGVLDAPEPAQAGTTVAKTALTWTIALDGRSRELEFTDAELHSDATLEAVHQAFELAFAQATAAR